VIDRSRWEHRWLFEHARKRISRSLARTFFSSLLPKSFWLSVKTTHTPRARRLVLYWGIAAAIAIAIPYVCTLLPVYWDLHQQRQQTLEWGRANPNNPRVVNALRKYGSYQAVIDRNLPYLPPWSMSRYADDAGRAFMRAFLQIAIALVAWPWLTFAALMIFQQTMRRAQIKPLHVLRCAIYSTIPAYLFLFPLTWVIRADSSIDYDTLTIARNSGLAIVALLAILSYRLAVAYDRYLTFPRPLVTSFASQLIVLLLLLAFSPWAIALW
jgi:hypothetical protein